MRPQQLTLPSRQSLLHGNERRTTNQSKFSLSLIYNCSTRQNRDDSIGLRRDLPVELSTSFNCPPKRFKFNPCESQNGLLEKSTDPGFLLFRREEGDWT